MRAIGEIKARELNKDAKISGGLSIASLNLREFLDGIGVELPPMQASDALNQFELVSRLNGSSKGMMLEELNLKLDGSTFTGNLGVSDFAKQALRADLKGDKLDLNRYLPPKTQDSAGAARKAEVKDSIAGAGKDGSTPLPDKPTQQAWSDEKVLPVDQLRKLDLQLALSLAQLTYDKHQLSDVNLKANGRGGLITVEEARGKLQGGSFVSSGRIDVRQAEPMLSLQQRVSRIPLEPLLKKDDQPSPIKGLLDLDAKFNTRGNSQKAWVEALNGNASFVLNDGVLVDANLEQQLCRGIATLNRKALSNPPTGKDTPSANSRAASACATASPTTRTSRLRCRAWQSAATATSTCACSASTTRWASPWKATSAKCRTRPARSTSATSASNGHCAAAARWSWAPRPAAWTRTASARSPHAWPATS